MAQDKACCHSSSSPRQTAPADAKCLAGMQAANAEYRHAVQ